MLNQSHLNLKVARIMLNNIGVREGKLNLTIIELFSSLTDQDFILMHKAGQLKNFCYALSLDLNTKIHEKDNSYSA
jgi:hypothetical protein